MKKVLLFLVLLCFSMVAVAQTAGDIPTDYIGMVLGLIKSIPYVGTVLAFVIQWAGLASGILTAVAIFLETVLKVPEVTARWAGASDLADKIQAFANKVLPWVKYFSMLNVQKNP